MRLSGRVLQDDRGPFLGMGATLFWAVWGYQHDRARLVQHLELLRTHGFEFVRVLGAVTGSSWEDRSADPRAAGYEKAIAGVTDLAFEHGLRVAWSIFGDTFATPTAVDRRALLERFLAMSKGREHKILSIEIANEGWQNGFGGRLDELQTLGRFLKERTPILVTITSPPPPLQCGPEVKSIYGRGAADYLTMHFDRDLSTASGRWGPVQQPLRWPSLMAACEADLPAVAASGEPIGPQSSVASEEDPLYVLTGALVTFTAGLPIYVWHTGPGVRGGGKADRERKRAANIGELPRADEMLRGFAALKRRLPADLPGWQRVDPTSSTSPFRIEVLGTQQPIAIVAARQGNDLIIVPFGIRDPLALRAAVAGRVEIIHPVTGAALATRELARDTRMELPAGVPALIISVRAS